VKKVLWTAVCSLMLLSLVISACGQATSSTTQATQTTQPTQSTQTIQPTQTNTTTQAVTTQASSDKPKYGGTLVTSLISDVTTFAGIENC
jgi:hypothetical protein